MSEVFKTSISLPGELSEFVAEEMRERGHRNRSLVIQEALRLLKRSRERRAGYRARTREEIRRRAQGVRESSPGGVAVRGHGEGEEAGAPAERPPGPVAGKAAGGKPGRAVRPGKAEVAGGGGAVPAPATMGGAGGRPEEEARSAKGFVAGGPWSRLQALR